MASTGHVFREPTGQPNYLGDENHPFPANRNFVSDPVLSEEAREEIWRRVVKQGEAIKTVSANFSVDMRRVAAVVRLKEVEKAWEREVSLFFMSFGFTQHTTNLSLLPR